MNVDDLEWQTRRYGGLSPRGVSLLLEHGHLDLVIQAAADRGEWFCAEGAVEELCRAGEFERALDVMEPFAVIGWRAALWAKTSILFRAGRTEEALDLVRQDEADPSSAVGCRHFAELLAKEGRVDEAIDMLIPHLDHGYWILSVLVEMAEGHDRDERVLELIAPHADSARQSRGDDRWKPPYSGAQELQVQVLERAGRADEAIRILGQDIAGRCLLAQDTLAHGLRPDTKFVGNLPVRLPVRAPQHDPAPLSQRLRRLRPPRPAHQRRPFVLGQHQLGHRPSRLRHESSLLIQRIPGAGH
ncbi:hypothetical protein [Streptomyces sp. NPDC055681]